jgi:hypothetical protein
MKIATLTFVLLTLTPPYAALAEEADVSIRTNRVREFAPESPSSVVLREGPSLYRRVTTRQACPELSTAHRIAFQIGTNLPAVEARGTWIPVNGRSNVKRVSSGTRHAAVVAISGDRRAACPIDKVDAIDEAAFDQVKRQNGSRDNRWSGDGSPGS